MFIQVGETAQALIDDEDLERVRQIRWCLHHRGYAYGWNKDIGKPCYLHRLIMGAPAGVEVDHINGDKLDCRKRNLRFTTRSQNLSNRPGNPRNTSGYRGVSLHGQTGRWTANIVADSRHYYLGVFDTREEAARAYNAKASELFGEFAILNELEAIS